MEYKAALSRFLYDVAKITFGTMVAGGIMMLVRGEGTFLGATTVASGAFMTTGLAFIAYKIHKSATP